MSEVDKLHDALERQRELIAALRAEVATKDAKIEQLANMLTEQYQTRQEAMLRFQAKRIAELESHLAAVLATVDAATAPDGRTYAEGCKP